VGDAIDESFEALVPAARRMKEATGLDLAPTLARVRHAQGGDRILL
jgi:hypothetical protein